MMLTKLPLATQRFDEPTTVTVEASWAAICENDIDWMEGEHFDHIEAAISIDVTPTLVTISTVRTLAAWKRGEEGAGRAIYEIPRKSLEAIYVSS